MASMTALRQAGQQPRTVFLRQPLSPSGARSSEVCCAKCNLRETCVSGCVPAEDLARIESIVYSRRRIRCGENLFEAGGGFKCIYAIRNGFFKTSLGQLAAAA